MKLQFEGMEFEIRRAVVKLGTKQVTDLKAVKTDNVKKIVGEMVELQKRGVEFVLTTSGAIGLGRHELELAERKDLTIAEKQALAGVGQIRLMELFKSEFLRHGISVGQALLTHDIFENRKTYLNARNTLLTMLSMGIVPVINENDTVAVDEIKFGDNDRLGALVALLVDADIYIMLSDIDGFYRDYDKPTKSFVRLVNMDDEPELKRHAGDKAHDYTSGGMATKLDAARKTTLSCVPSVIANGFKEGVLTAVLEGMKEGTLFVSNRCRLSTKKRWISGKRPKGRIVIDAGAASAVRGHKSLLASGIVRAEGKFAVGDLALVVDTEGREIAMGFAEYTSEDVNRIAGKKSDEAEKILGYRNANCVVHVDNMVIL